MREYLIPPFLGIVLVFCAIFLWKSRRWVADASSTEQNLLTPPDPKYRRVILLLALLAYVVTGMLSFGGWMKGDDWNPAIALSNYTFVERIGLAIRQYMGWVPRFGEIIRQILGFSLTRWQMWITVAPAAALAPFAFFALVRKPGSSIFSRQGALFYITVFCLCLLGVRVHYWINYMCYSAALNYLCTTVICIYFLSFYRLDQVRTSSILSCVGVFLLGIISGWSTECFSATALPCLTAWLVYVIKCRKNSLPWRSYWGYAGFLLGCFALFASPAHSRRSSIEFSNGQSPAAQMSPAELDQYLGNLTPQNVEKLMGKTRVVVLKDIPLADHIRFVPYMAKILYESCYYGLYTFAALLLLLYLGRRKAALKTIGRALCFALMAWICASSYLVQCIPTHMSFLPPCFILIAGCAYATLRLESSRLSLIVAAILFAIACKIFVPAGIEVWQYKKYEWARYDRIQEMKSRGITDIVLDPPYPKRPKDRLQLIHAGQLSDNPQVYPNPNCARYFNVSSIRQKEETF